jgi:hypothetical protein
MSDEPFIVRQFEGRAWVTLEEAARLHDAVQEAGVTIAGLRNALQIAELKAEQQERFKWRANERADAAEAARK